MSETINIRQIAALAKLSVTPAEEERLSREMEAILAFGRQLQELPLEGVPQTQHILDQHAVLRTDAVQPGLPSCAVLEAAPARLDEYIAVPRTVE